MEYVTNKTLNLELSHKIYFVDKTFCPQNITEIMLMILYRK